MSPQSNGEIKARLIAAASALFAERGFHGTKARDIAARAGVNLAASNYRYGSKKDLYLEVLRAQFAEFRSLLARPSGTAFAPAPERRMLGGLFRSSEDVRLSGKVSGDTSDTSRRAAVPPPHRPGAYRVVRSEPAGGLCTMPAAAEAMNHTD